MNRLIKIRMVFIFLFCLLVTANAYADKWAAADERVDRESRKHGAQYGQQVANYMIENLAKLEYYQMVNINNFERILKLAIREYEPWLLQVSVELLEDAYEEKLSPADIQEWRKKAIIPMSQMTMIGMRQMRLNLIQTAMEYQRDNR